MSDPLLGENQRVFFVMDLDFKRYIPIEKIDPDKRMVYGWASTPSLDSQGEIVSVESLQKALPDYMKFPAVREMHSSKAAGVTKEAKTTPDGLFIGAKIVSDEAWNFVKEGVYRGFSIGGKIKKKVDNVIQSLDLTEISLVDVPADRNSVFTLVKREGGQLVDKQQKDYGDDVPPSIQQHLDMLSKYKHKFGKEVKEDMPNEKKETEGTPQDPEKETPKDPVKDEKEETTEVSEESSQKNPQKETVIDETKQTADQPDDIMKRLEKVETALAEPEEPEVNVEIAKVMTKVDAQFAKVTSIIEMFAERMEKMEGMAAPIKAKAGHVVEKFAGSGDEVDSEELVEKETRFKELKTILKTDMARYQRENLGIEAIDLKYEISKLKGGEQ